MKRNQRKVLIGIVKSTKNAKTATVQVESRFKHPLYHKSVVRNKKYQAHNEGEVLAKDGDKVQIVETRPLSATKRFRIAKIIERAK
ncbi:30S ribosomal protein S17 [Mycoplasmoides pneumoniae]|uniref:Small ribosomal subunit protein uS17 n=1 Tax=Mycoplasmoides pneumoniae 309 TaxID=1112856 RepID=A0AB33HP98_MYCPM|nr:30S ribosomal protein S17 [Mycoplasmoides pneumoniae]ARQ34327.1 30S ribosomal protein S17 [Mycoplasmoides pneumoniae]ARQ41410.1 30S ribosomal protein S17 [Mycoplasmoides pneumoniae]ARQ43537.1 30S ribosomal protein S17 [Mycoplasmoides pneumoniae]QHR07943.1 30S ribosomal protein S17 [Mycoplasmoides pneumoniae]QHR10045.1 30S ribosomal protein S17 [Mycoplasmoides pneumoniae]